MTVKESELFGCIARENAIDSVANRWHSRRASTSIDRGIATDRIGVENRFWRLLSMGEVCSGPENRGASISFC